MIDFDDWCARNSLTERERVECAHFLANLRQRRTLDACLYRPGRTLRRNNERALSLPSTSKEK